MEAIKTALFDNPLPIFVALAILELIFMVAFARRRTLRRGLLLATPTVLAVIVCLTWWLVPTDRKAILAASTAICADIQAGKKDALEANLDGKFSGIYAGAQLDKQGAIRAAKSLKEALQITRMLLVPSASKIDVHNGRAWMTAIILMTGSSELLGTGNGRVTIDLVWIKGPDAVWRILESKEPQ
jgi:hypothetical protein